MLFQMWSVLHSCPATTFIAWINAHANMHGNEMADHMAKWAARAPPPEFHRAPPKFSVFYFLQQASLSTIFPF